MWVKIVFLGLYLLNLGQISKGATYTYKHSVDLYDSKNWENGKPQENCDGLILPKAIPGVITAKSLEIKQLVFGNDEIFFFNDDTNITFNENSKSVMNCIKINSDLNHPKSWIDFKNWIIQGKEENSAVPHLERLPGQYDDVIFPKGILSGQVFIESDTSIKSLKFGTEQWTSWDFLEHNKDTLLSETLVGDELNIKNVPCLDESGCDSGNEVAYRDYCLFMDLLKTFDCVDPIEAIGFCNKICGATILFEPSASLKIREIEEKLGEYNSDTHVSKVKNMDGDYIIQIVFTEKKFTGDSLEEAKDLEQKLIKEKIIQAENLKFIASGYYYKEGATGDATVSIIFGTLAGACLLFGLLFLIFENEGRLRNVRERLGLGQGPLTYRSIIFSRNLSVSEGAGLIIETQEPTAEASHGLPKSFENPTFFENKKRSPSTSESSDDSKKDTAKQIQSEVDAKSEPDLFEDQVRRALIKSVIDDGEFVDLSEMK